MKQDFSDSAYHAKTGIGSSSGSPPAIKTFNTPRLEKLADPNMYDVCRHLYDVRCRCVDCVQYEIDLNEEILEDIKLRGY